MHAASNKLSSSFLLGLGFLALSCTSIYSDDLSAIKDKAFSSGNACFLDNTGGSNPYYSIHLNNGQNSTIKLAPNLAHPKALRYTLRDFGTHGKIDHIYIGGHKTLIGDEVHDTLIKLGLCPYRTYKHQIFTHEYLRNIPMKLVLRTVDDFRSFANYLKGSLANATYQHPNKPVLLLELADDPTLATLNENDKTFIAEHFTLTSHTTYFNECWKDLMEQNSDLEGSRPEFRCESIAETLLRQTEKACNYFVGHDIAVGITWKISSMIAGIIAYENIIKPIARTAAGSICDCCSSVNIFKS